MRNLFFSRRSKRSIFALVTIFSLVFGTIISPYQAIAFDLSAKNLDLKKNVSNDAITKYSNTLKQLNSSKNTSRLNSKEDYVVGEILIKYKDNRINLKTFYGRIKELSFTNSKSLEKKEDLKNNNISVLKIKDSKTVEQKIAELKNDPSVEYVQPNYQYYSVVIDTNDTDKGLLWGLDNTGQTINGSYGNITGTNDKDIDAPEAWTINEGTNSSIIVAVIDSGVAYNHPDLLANMWDGTNCVSDTNTALGGCNHGYDYEDNDKTPLPTDNSHGTHIAGTIAAVKNNSKGIIGVAPQAKIMAIKSSLTTSNVVQGINFAKENGAKVINASWIGSNFDQLLKDAIVSFPGIFVAASGNYSTNNENTHYYPSDYNLDNIISVAATDQNDALASFSNYGVTSVDVGAPGTNIYSTVSGSTIDGSTILNETFDSLTPPAVPSDWVKGGTNNKWATYDFGFTKVLYGQVPSLSYDNNTNSTITSPTYNLNGSGATINFITACDTEYSTTSWVDYIALEYSSDGGSNFTEILRYDEVELDFLNGDSNQSGNAVYEFGGRIPSQYLTNNFKLRFRWVTNSSDNNYDGCLVDNIKITKFSDGSDEGYDYSDGTSMATPHVAGLVALIEGYNPSLTTSQVKNAILTTGDSVASLFGKIVSGKRINAQSALQSVNPAKAITSFTIPSQIGTTTIDESAKTIAVTMPYGTDVTALISTFTIIGASVAVGATPQISTTTPNNFTSPVTYTVTAADGSTQEYIVTITIAEAMTSTISGTIKYYDGIKVIPNATVILEDGAGNQLATATTDESGVYQFADIASGSDYVVRASKSDNNSGLSNNDQIKIGRHIVGLELFSTIFKTIAGDVNNSGGLTSNDQIKIGRFIVGLDSNLTSGSWKFYSSDATLTTQNYLNTGLTRIYPNLIVDTTSQDFVGIKMGDVNNSWVNN